MPERLSCPECSTILPERRGDLDRDVRCAGCGKSIPVESAEWNPYAAPVSALIDGIGEPGREQVVPPSVLGKLALSVRLLGTNLPLFSLIILTVWLPANLAIESLLLRVPAEQELSASFRLNSIIQGVFGPISLGALTFAVARRLRDERIGYVEAMAVGFRNWGRLFAARFFANLRILLGIIALVVPGIVLGVRYSLLEPVVILERAADPRGRSTDLTRGRGWRIFVAYAIYYAITILCGTALGYALPEVDSPNALLGSVAAGCILDVVGAICTIILVLFYLEARQGELANPVSLDDKDDLKVDPGSWDLD